jgi:hypothetical protein
VEQVWNLVPVARDTLISGAVTSLARFFTIHANTIDRGLLDFLIVVIAAVVTLILLAVDKIQSVASFALYAVIDFSAALGALLIALHTLLLAVVTIGIVDVSFRLTLGSACACDRIKLHEVFTLVATSWCARAFKTRRVALRTHVTQLNG